MEPFDPQDPLWKLLGKSQQPKVRSQFLANVVREARNTAQDRSVWSRLKGWWADLADPLPLGRILATTAAVAVVGLISLTVFDPTGRTEPALGSAAQVSVAETPADQRVGELPLVPEVETQLESLDYLDALLALEDTSGFTDSEIAYLLY
jgi:hypothetical protein